MRDPVDLPTFAENCPEDLIAMADKYAAQAWKTVVAMSLESGQGPNYRLVQATTLLAIFDFTGASVQVTFDTSLTEAACKYGTAWVKIGLALSLWQALQMTDEPSRSISCAAREEHRRTLWSIYLLDKMATCGRRRPNLFLDSNYNLQLPIGGLTSLVPRQGRSSLFRFSVKLPDLPSHCPTGTGRSLCGTINPTIPPFPPSLAV